MAVTRSFNKVNRSEIFAKTVLNKPKFKLFPVKFPVNKKFQPETRSLKTASTSTLSFKFLGKDIASERPKISNGYRLLMRAFYRKLPLHCTIQRDQLKVSAAPF